jgi:hypothetical protein
MTFINLVTNASRQLSAANVCGANALIAIIAAETAEIIFFIIKFPFKII